MKPFAIINIVGMFSVMALVVISMVEKKFNAASPLDHQELTPRIEALEQESASCHHSLNRTLDEVLTLQDQVIRGFDAMGGMMEILRITEARLQRLEKNLEKQAAR